MISETIIMKKTIKYIAALAAILCSVSCSLDEKSFTEIEKDEYMNSPKEAQNVLLGVYRNLQEDAMYGMNLSLYFTLGTDEAKVEGSTPNSWRDLPCNTFSTSKAMWRTVGRHSTTLFTMPMTSSNASPAKLKLGKTARKPSRPSIWQRHARSAHSTISSS